jgi:hypothetical protein
MRLLVLAAVVSGFLSPLAVTSAAEPAADPFAEGAIWVGEFKVTTKDSEVQNWALTVTERKGKAFKGDILVKVRDKEIETIQVEGTATEKSTGAIVCKTEKKGLAQVKLSGKLQGGEAVLIFSGTNKFGQPGAGVATLKAKN